MRTYLRCSRSRFSSSAVASIRSSSAIDVVLVVEEERGSKQHGRRDETKVPCSYGKELLLYAMYDCVTHTYKK